MANILRLMLNISWKRLFQGEEERAKVRKAEEMADELISIAQGEWQLQVSAIWEIPDLLEKPEKYACIIEERSLREIKTAFLLGHLLANSRQYDFQTVPEVRAFALLLNLLCREGVPFEQARQETIALRRVIESGDTLTRAIVYRGEVSVKDHVFHPHVSDIVIHMSNLE